MYRADPIDFREPQSCLVNLGNGVISIQTETIKKVRTSIVESYSIGNTSFDMRGQVVENQNNAGHSINIGAEQKPIDLVTELEKLKEKLTQARQGGIIDDDSVIIAENEVTKAVQEIKKPLPNKKTILDHLNRVKLLIEDVTAASGLVTALVGAIEAVHKLFL